MISSANKKPELPRFPGLDATYNNHLFLQDRNEGNCRKLMGNINITFVLLNDAENCWDYKSSSQFCIETKKTKDKLTEQAKKYGVTLNITERYIHAQVSEKISMENYKSWVDDAIKSANLDKTFLKDTTDCYENPIFFCLCREGRAYACRQFGNNIEYCVLYKEDSDYRHELMHIFGAKDYYMGARVKAAAQAYFPDSIMLSSDIGNIDELTAYLIGWTDRILPSALKFLNATADVTQKELNLAWEESTFTGTKTIRYGNGTYSGELVEGVPFGKGKLVNDNGNSYNGDWVYGSKSGVGCFKWSTGEVYSGEWKDGMMDGYGCFKWNGGTEYKGEWKENRMNGYGILTYSDGTQKSGYWENGEYVK